MEEKNIVSKQNSNEKIYKLNNSSLIDVEPQIKISSIDNVETENPYLVQLGQSQPESAIYPSKKTQTEPNIKDIEINSKEDTCDQLDWIDLEQGISGSILAKRLGTNPSTLRKYLREQKQIQWAAERDPDKLGWIYDPLLQRYYLTQVDCDEIHAISSVTTEVNSNEDPPCRLLK